MYCWKMIVLATTYLQLNFAIVARLGPLLRQNIDRFG